MATENSHTPYDNELKPEAVEKENGPSDYRELPRPTFSSRLNNHFKRFWWLHLIIVIVCALIITLCLLYVAMPNIAQTGINNSKLLLYQQIVTDATPSSVHLHLVTISESNSTFHPVLSPFNVSLFLEDTEPHIVPFGYLEIPRTQSLSKKYIVVDQTMTIANMTQFIAYNKLILTSKTYRVAIRGRVTIHEESFPAPTVNFNKVLTSTGMNNLEGFRVLNFSISLTPAPDGTNLYGQAFIPNTSPITVNMGEVVQDLYVDGQPIGNNTIADLTLFPGNNIVNFTGVTDQATVLELITTKYTNGILPVSIVGNSSIVNGQHIPYFEAALAAVNLQAQLDVGSALAAIGLNIGALGGSAGSSSSSVPASTGGTLPSSSAPVSTTPVASSATTKATSSAAKA